MTTHQHMKDVIRTVRRVGVATTLAVASFGRRRVGYVRARCRTCINVQLWRSHSRRSRQRTLVGTAI